VSGFKNKEFEFLHKQKFKKENPRLGYSDSSEDEEKSWERSSSMREIIRKLTIPKSKPANARFNSQTKYP
jgi:hypothetical protein